MPTTKTETVTPPPASGINIWQVMTGLATALLIAAVLGLFGMYKAQSDLSAAFNKLAEDGARREVRLTKLENDFIDYRITTNAKLTTIDNIKEGVDRLNRLQDASRK